MSARVSNPFSTRFVAPGQLNWIASSHSIDQLVSLWFSGKRLGAILGNHGSGKSTLLAHLVPRLARAVWQRDAEGKVTESTQLDTEQSDAAQLDEAQQVRARRAVFLQLRASAPQSMVIPWERLERGDLLVLDGYEQLGALRRLAVLCRASCKHIGLLVTAHHCTLLPTLCNLNVSFPVARAAVDQLLQNDEATQFKVSDEVLRRLLEVYHHNLRDVLMALYDRFEEQIALSKGPTANPSSAT